MVNSSKNLFKTGYTNTKLKENRHPKLEENRRPTMKKSQAPHSSFINESFVPHSTKEI